MSEENLMSIDEVVSKYQDVPLKFTNYYKFDFTFSGVSEDGVSITVRRGGSDSIYRFEVNPDSVVTLGAQPKSEWNSIIISKAGEQLFEHWDY